MITASKLAIAIAVAGPLAAATVGESFATPLPSSAVAVRAAATGVQYRAYDYGPYAYRPYGGYPYPYGGYTYWYPAFPYWDSNTWNPAMVIIEMARPSTITGI
jgi:hypothetical protein